MSTPLLDLPISFFEYDRKRNVFANVPSQQTTLRRIGSTRYYKSPIEAIRAEQDKVKQDEMKKYQPAITPVALLNHRKANTTNEEKIKQQWAMLMGDIDKKDNPNINMAELKKHLSTLPYVLLCAYSVRGGLWFIVRLPDGQTPESLAAHFRYLQKLFSKIFGIKLDSTKGGKPTDLRFVSFDEEPYFNDSATIMEGTYTPPPPKPKPIQYRSSIKEDEETLLKRLVRFIEKAGEGERHEMLLKAARLAGGFIAAGRINEETTVYALETVASEWPNHSKSQKTIRDGIKYGMSAPIYPEERIAPKNVKREISKQPACKTDRTPNQPAELIAKSSIIPDEILDVEICDTYPADWDTVLNPAISFVPPATRVNHSRAPLAFDAAEQLRRIQWIVIPPGVEEADHNPVLVDSPNRNELASILGIPSDQLPLYQLHRP